MFWFLLKVNKHMKQYSSIRDVGEFMKIFSLLMATMLFFAFDASSDPNDNKDSPDEAMNVICKIVNYSHTIGGPIITVVIIGAALLAIFGRMPWPALVALGIFTGVFFGAPKIAQAISGKSACDCPQGQAKQPDGTCK